MSHRSRWEYFKAIEACYRQAERGAKQVILSEFCLSTGYHRKYAIRLLNGPPPDNGSEFVNWHLGAMVREARSAIHARPAIQKRRPRPHRAEELDARAQAAELDRYDTPEAVAALNDLYRHELRWTQNLYLPSMKLVKKVRVGSKLRRVYQAAQTPLDRGLTSPGVNAERVAELKALRDRLDPFQLARTIDRKLQRIYALTHPRLSPRVPDPKRATE